MHNTYQCCQLRLMFDENLDLREINFAELIHKCGKCRIFLSLRFYVKSKFAIIESQNLHICTNSDTLNFAFHEFLHFLKAEIHQKTKFTGPKTAKIHKKQNAGPLNVTKWQILHF